MLTKKKSRLMAGLLSIFMVLAAVLSPTTYAANTQSTNNKSQITIRIPRNGKDRDENSPARELKVYKISEENLTSKELEEKRLKYDAMTIAEVEKEFEPVGETLKSTVEDSHDVIRLENLTPGAYLLKETDDSAEKHEYRITSTTTNIQAGIVDVQEINVKTEQHKKVPLVLHKIAYKDESSDLEPIDLEGVTFNLLRKNEDGEEEAINLEKTADGIYAYKEDQGEPDLVTNADGKIEINNLPDGDYFFRETQTIEDYIINEDERDTEEFTYNSEEGRTKTVVNRKEGQRFTIGLHKVDGNTNEDLAGVEFRLYVKAGKNLTPVGIDENGNYDIGNQYTDTFTTNEKGEIAIEGLPELAEANTYVFREVKQRDGYVINNDNNYPVKRNEVVEVKNFKNPTPIELRLNKVDSITDEPIDKVGFELFKVVTNENDDNTAQITEERVGVKGKAGLYEFRDDLAESEIEYQLYTGVNGQIDVRGLPEGEYFFRENQPQKDYNLAENRGKESEGLSRENPTFTIKNRPVTPPSVSPPTPNSPYGSYNFVKVDDSKEQKRLAGATFALYKVSEDGKQTPYEVNGKRYTVKSGDNGEFKVENLPYGKYVLRETAAPAGYILDVNPIEFTISKDSANAEAIMIVNKRNPDRPVTPPVVSPPGTTPPRTTTPPTTRTTVPPVVSPPKTYYVPKDTPGVPRGPLVKTGDIRILVFIAIGLIMILFGNHIVRKEEKTQIGRVPLQ
ncbi:SpaA isopeptide-forming pilin-related protein [Anaerococcus sp. ENR1011]|uniref:SpaA isopeptide-forming pilin-related protein n=1 Tax=Anaerococcus groningensis TaxID=3115616 RepID=A0ABW9MYW6_9FIRM